MKWKFVLAVVLGYGLAAYHFTLGYSMQHKTPLSEFAWGPGRTNRSGPPEAKYFIGAIFFLLTTGLILKQVIAVPTNDEEWLESE